MILVALIVGVILIVAAIRNSQAALFAALAVDVPGFVLWAAAIVAVGAIGFIPGIKPVSRGLLALVLLVIILNNYKAILAGLASASVPGTAAATAAAASTSTASSGAAPSSTATPSAASISSAASSASTLANVFTSVA